MINNKKVILSTTSCKRLDLLTQSIRSFSVFCKDKSNIDEIHYYDDSSSDEERTIAINLYHTYIPNVPIYYKFFDKNSFPDNYRHARILNNWLEGLINTNAEYVFHLEDDHKFLNFFNLYEPINIMEHHDEYAYIGYCQSWKNFPETMTPTNIIGNFYETLFLKNRPINECLFIDDVQLMQQGFNMNEWVCYINWPYFSLRPGIHNVNKLISVGEFSTTYDRENMSVELEFAIRWMKKGYKSMMCKEFVSYHSGQNPELSAYKNNNSAR